MKNLADRVDALERAGGTMSQAEITKAMDMLAARARAILDGATELPPEPPPQVLAEIERRPLTPEDMDNARVVRERLLSS